MKKKKLLTALVAEGGGMRGIFGAGVLDAFTEGGFDPFDLYLGVSAGACNISSHLAKQKERNLRIYTRIMTRPDFISAGKFLRGGHFMDLDWLWDTIAVEETLDVPSVMRALGKKKEFLITTTAVQSGGPRYLEASADDCNEALKASSAIPFLYRRSLTVRGEALVDGGVADPLPAREAFRRGARRIVVIRTRVAKYTKKKGMENVLSSLATRKHPALSRAVLAQADTYSRCVEYILNPPADTEITQIAPASPLVSGRTTQDIAALMTDYETGRALGKEFIRRWKD